MTNAFSHCVPPDGTADGTWHWLSSPHQEKSQVLSLWLTGANETPLWAGGELWMLANEAFTRGYRYIAPVATPEEVDALAKKTLTDGLDTPLPCTIEIAHIRYSAGIALRIFVDAARRWHREAGDAVRAKTELANWKEVADALKSEVEALRQQAARAEDDRDIMRTTMTEHVEENEKLVQTSLELRAELAEAKHREEQLRRALSDCVEWIEDTHGVDAVVPAIDGNAALNPEAKP